MVTGELNSRGKHQLLECWRMSYATMSWRSGRWSREDHDVVKIKASWREWCHENREGSLSENSGWGDLWRLLRRCQAGAGWSLRWAISELVLQEDQGRSCQSWGWPALSGLLDSAGGHLGRSLEPPEPRLGLHQHPGLCLCIVWAQLSEVELL